MSQRRLVTWAATCGLLTILAGPLAAQSDADAPTAHGWWNATHQGVQPPPPPDVPPDGLLVQGAAARPVGAGAPSLGGGPAAAGSTQAIAALTFTLPPETTVEKLVLQVVGESPPSVSVTACAISGPYEPVQNGEFAKRPAYNCALTVTPTFDPGAGTLMFGSDLVHLVRGNQLVLALVPGELDRLVFAKPDSHALSVRLNPTSGAGGESPFDSGRSPALSSPSFRAGADTASSGADFGSSDTFSFYSGSLASGSTPPLNAGQPSPSEVRSPVTAPALGGARAGPSSLAGRGADTASDKRTLLLLLGLVAVGAAFFFSAQRDAASAGAAGTAPQERGLGRFRQPRTSRSVPL